MVATDHGVVIAGAGDVGSRLAQRLLAQGRNVITLRRQSVAVPAGVTAIRADLATGAGLESLPRRAQAVVFCAAPDRRDEATYRALFIDGLQRVREHVDAPRLVFVSSTAVYAEDAGECVDEQTRPDPPGFNGRVLLEAEHTLADHPGAIVLRLTGLYGPGRAAMIRRAQSGMPGRPHWTNRIHVDDAATALAHLLELASPQPLYLGSDDTPALESDVFDWMRKRQGWSDVPAVLAAQSGRRVMNAQLRASGWAPRHRDYRSGYSELLAIASDT